MFSEICLSDGELRQLLEPTAQMPDLARCECHLEGCDDCRRRLEQLAGSARLLPLAEDTCDLVSPELTRVIRDLCQLHPSAQPPTKNWTSSDHIIRQFTPSSQPESLGRLGRYEILRIIGRGGMGTVFAALDRTLHRQVAIKVPTPSLVATSDSHDRFVREARTMAAVKHDHIVTIHGVEESNGVLFLVMEYVEGQSLEQRLAKEPRMEVHEVIRIATQIASALTAAHACGLVHRDIKPGNILLERPEDRVKVADFGLARFAADPALTASGLVAGTPEFMAPEQASDESVTPQSDLFSLGVVLYAALTGGSPFRGRNALSTLRRICSDTPPSLRQLNAQVPDWFDQLIQQLLSKDPADRPASALELLRILEQHASGSPMPQTALSTALDGPTGRWRPALTARKWVVFGCCAGGILAATWLLLPRGENRKPAEATVLTDALTLRSSAVAQGFYVGGGDQVFDNLGEAIAAAANGDVIRVVGNGPFIVPGFDTGEKSLTIQSDPGYSPVFLATSPEQPNAHSFLRARGHVRLQGLEIHWQMKPMPVVDIDARSQMCVLFVDGANLELARCRIIGGRMTCCAGVSRGSLKLDGCLVSTLAAPSILWDPSEDDQLQINNCVFQGRVGLMCDAISDGKSLTSVKVSVSESTFSTDRAIQLLIGQPLLGYRLRAERNVFDVENLVVLVPQNSMRPLRRQANSNQTRRLIRSLFEWTDQQNVYRRKMSFVARGLLRADDTAQQDVDSLEEWLAMWNASSTGSLAADFQYETNAVGGKSLTPRIVGLEADAQMLPQRCGADESRVGPD